jgi:hypothetical protein
MMQYILTQAEYDELRTKQELDLKLKKQELQKLCTKIADTMPVSVSWRRGCKPEPWGCILTPEGDPMTKNTFVTNAQFAAFAL